MAEPPPDRVAGSAAEIADWLAELTGPEARAELEDRLAGQSALEIADDLVKELQRRPPTDRLYAVARQLAEHGTRHEAVKFGIVLLGVCGGPQDRDLLLLLGGLDELTPFAVGALMNTQPDPQRAAYELARQVSGWGRIHAVERLAGCDDPEIKAWLLRDGFRNWVMDEYLAHFAATTGDLHTALLAPQVDDALLDGAGGILAALAAGGPAADMHDYRDAVPVMHRYAELIAVAEPTLGRLNDLVTVARFVHRKDESFDWPPGEPDLLNTRYSAVLARPAWQPVVLVPLADPSSAYEFNTALSCAAEIGVDAFPQALAHLERHPYAAFVWQWAIHNADTTAVATVIEHAERLLPLADLATGPSRTIPIGRGHAPDRVLEVLVDGLDRHPGEGLSIIGVALANRIIRVRRRAIKTLVAWPAHAVTQQSVALVTAAVAAEPNDELRSEMTAFLTLAGTPQAR